MARKTIHMRVHPDFDKLVKKSDLTSRDFTKIMSEKIWKEEIIKEKKPRGLRGFRL